MASAVLRYIEGLKPVEKGGVDTNICIMVCSCLACKILLAAIDTGE
jgi:hypothetical protein